MTKTALKYILVIFIVVVIGLFIAYFFIVGTNEDIEDFDDIKNTYIFGNLISDDVSTGDSVVIGDDRGILDGNGMISGLRKISSSPIAGFISFQNSDDIEFIRYVEKATGHVYESSTNSSTQERISNTTVPKIQEAIWIDPDSLVIRYVDDNDDVKSFYAVINQEEESDLIDGEIEGVFLVDNIASLMKLNKQIFWLLTGNAGATGIISNPDGSRQDKVFDSSANEWNIQYPQKGTLMFTTKPSSDINGYMYMFDINKERMTKILSGIKGLTTLTNGSKTTTLFSRSQKNGFSLGVYDFVDGKSNSISLRTFPEKCVWAGNGIDVYCGVPKLISNNNYPDDWYQGLISFSDEIWKIDTENGNSEKISSPEVEIDVVEPFLGTNEEYLFFLNKRDSSLWSLEL